MTKCEETDRLEGEHEGGRRNHSTASRDGRHAAACSEGADWAGANEDRGWERGSGCEKARRVQRHHHASYSWPCAPGSRGGRGRCLLVAALVCSMMQLGTSVPMGARDLEDGDGAVPPTHYSSKNLDLSQPRPVVNGYGTSEDEFEDLSNQKRAPPHPRGQIRTIPKTARVEALEQEVGDDGDQDFVKTSVWTVAFNTLLMAVASGLGAAPFFIVHKVKRRWLGIANALASGVMLAASFGLIQEGLEGVKQHPGTLPRLMGGMIIGLVFIIVSQRLVEGHEMEMGSLRGLDARKALMVMGIMTLHSFSEGLGVGVSYGGQHGRRQGMVTTWAIALHNIPEGLAVALVAVPRGESKWTAASWAVISSLPQPLVAIPAYLFVEWFSFLLPFGLGCAAGTMIWMVFAELIPDALKETDAHTIATTLTLALIFQVGLQSVIEASM